MTITTIVHGGQTGVDRGAAEAAHGLRLKARGFLPANGRDESGLVPAYIADEMTTLEYGGYVERTRANINLVRERHGALLVITPNRQRIETPGTKQTIDYAEYKGLPLLICDPNDNEDNANAAIHFWLARQAYPVTHLMVAGPRESLWKGARSVTSQFLLRLLDPHLQPSATHVQTNAT